LITRMMFGEEYGHKASCYVIFSIPLLPRLSYAQISSALYSRKPSANLSLPIWETKFHNHTKSSVILNLYTFG
jgi:hypothetical protein